MFSRLRSIVGSVDVIEQRGTITITGINSKTLLSDIRRLWSTSRVGNNIFSKVRGGSVEFPAFFAIEIDFMLGELINWGRSYIPTRVLLAARNQLREKTWIASIEKEPRSRMNKDRVKELKVTLLPHQARFIDIYDERTSRYGLKGYILGAAPGTGKTYTALALMLALEVDTVFVVSPNNAIDEVWAHTVGTGFKKTQKYWVSSSSEDPELGCSHYIMHYEYLGRFLEWAQAHQGEFGRVGIILDESHNFNEVGSRPSQRIQHLLALSQMPEVSDVLWQSGTPFKAMGNEVITFFKSADPLFTDQVEAQFRPIFGREAKKALDILAHRIGIVTYTVESVTTEPIITQLKGKLEHGREFTLAHISRAMAEFIKERMAYYESNLEHYHNTYFRLIEQVRHRLDPQELERYLALTRLLHESYDPKVHKDEPRQANHFEDTKIIPHLEGKDRHDFRAARSVYKYYWLKVQGEALGRILGRERARCSTDLATKVETFHLDDPKDKEGYTLMQLINSSNSKTVIFTNYVKTVEAIAEHLRAQGLEPITVHAQTGESITQAVTRFEREDNLNPMVATFKSLSTAVPLVMASTTVMVDQPFRDNERKQAIARTARLGQVHPVRIFDLYLDTGTMPNISTRTKDIMEWSRAQVEKIMGRTVADTVSTETLEVIAPLLADLPDQLPSDVGVSLEGFELEPVRSRALRMLYW